MSYSFNPEVNSKPSIKQIILNQELKLKQNKVLKCHSLQKYELQGLLDQIKGLQNLVDVMGYMIDKAQLGFTCNDCFMLEECTLKVNNQECELKKILEGDNGKIQRNKTL